MRTYFLFAIILSVSTLQAQNNTVSAGGKAVGSTGSSTFSVGQIAYLPGRDANFSTSEGLQQPFEIIPLATNTISNSQANLKVYPNPAFSGFYIRFSKDENKSATYNLSDISGKDIKHGEISDVETFVPIDELTSGIYFLKISNASAQYRSYKIIKQ